MTMNEMRAALYDRYGPPEVLYEGRVPKPVSAPGEVLVRVHATSVNGGESLVRTGKLRAVTGLVDRGFPKRVGVDFTGEIAETSVTAYRVGDRVWGALPRRFGSAAEYLALPTTQIAPAPTSIDLVQAAALPAVGTTAITALRDKARLRPGERLLVRGASGGVGSVAVQLGHSYGARVTALAGKTHHETVLALGADEVFDYRTTSPRDLPRFDVVLDMVGTDLRAYRNLLTPTGRMVVVAFDINHVARSITYLLAAKALSPSHVHFFSGNPKTALFADLAHLTDSGAISPVVDTVFPLADIAKAHETLETTSVKGKLVVQVA